MWLDSFIHSAANRLNVRSFVRSFVMSDIALYAAIVICACLLYGLASLLYHYLYVPYTIYRGYVAQNIPAAPFRPFVGQLPDMVAYMRQDKGLDYGLEMVDKHGALYVSGFGPTIRLVISDADYLAALLKTNAADFAKGEIAKRLLSPLIGRDGLFLADEPTHNRNRKLIAPMFHHDGLRGMIDIIVRLSSTAIDQVIREVDIAGGEATVELHQFFSNLTLSVIASTAFGAAFDNDDLRVKETVYSAFTTVLEAIVYRAHNMLDVIPIVNAIPFSTKQQVDSGCRAIADVVRTVIADRKSGRTKSLTQSHDLLDLLLQARHSDGEGLGDEQIMQESLTFILAGHETTSNLLCWIIVELTERPDVWRECRDEVDRVLRGDKPTVEQLNELVSVDAVVREVLRLTPPAPMHMRQAIRDTMLAPPNQQKPIQNLSAEASFMFNHLHAAPFNKQHCGRDNADQRSIIVGGSKTVRIIRCSQASLCIFTFLVAVIVLVSERSLH